MARNEDVIKRYRELEIVAKVKDVARTSQYSSDDDLIAETQTTVRLGGRFDRTAVMTLVTSVVNQLINAFDEGEGPEPGHVEDEPRGDELGQL